MSMSEKFTQPVAAIILGAGKGTRMKSNLPKVMHKIASLSMVGHVLKAVDQVAVSEKIVVIGPNMEIVATEVAPTKTVVQEQQAGTGDAAKSCLSALSHFKKGTILVLFGDTPFISSETLINMVRQRENGHSVVVLAFEAKEPGAYGRLLTDQDGTLEAIIEAKDATAKQLEITLCNSGVMAFDAAYFDEILAAIDNENASGEYYLTDAVKIARNKGLSCCVSVTAESTVLGVNSRVQLAQAEKIFQTQKREAVMLNGATLLDPDTVYFAHDTEIGQDVVIEPNVMFGPNVIISDNVTIKAHSHLEGAIVKNGASVGPYARLRPGAILEENSFVGNFVEVKNTRMKPGAKASHLTYLGDAEIGEKANIGAGTITCNYDGFNKSKTVIGAHAFIGSNSSLVAPVQVGENALVSAGSVITKNVDDNAMAFARAVQKEKAGMAARFKASAKAKKDAAKASNNKKEA